MAVKSLSVTLSLALLDKTFGFKMVKALYLHTNSGLFLSLRVHTLVFVFSFAVSAW